MMLKALVTMDENDWELLLRGEKKKPTWHRAWSKPLVGGAGLWTGGGSVGVAIGWKEKKLVRQLWFGSLAPPSDLHLLEDALLLINLWFCLTLLRKDRICFSFLEKLFLLLERNVSPRMTCCSLFVESPGNKKLRHQKYRGKLHMQGTWSPASRF